MMNKHIFLAILLCIGMNTGAALAAPIGSGFSYQGELLDSGSPANGNYDVIVDAYQFPTGNSVVASQTFLATVVTNGLFNIEQIDFGDTLYKGDEVWLEVSVRSSGGGSYTMLTPRQRVSASPYAVQAQFLAANGAGNGDVLQFDGTDWVAATVNVTSPWNTAAGTSIEHAGNVGINRTNPFAPLHVGSTGSGDVAIFDSPANTNLMIWEGGLQRGYIGSTLAAGGDINDSDIDVGTRSSNTTGNLHLTIKKVPKLTIDSDGQVGIGTTNPMVPFHVVSGQSTAAYFDATANSSLFLLENGVSRGFLGSTQAIDADFELSTDNNNNDGDLHLSIRSVPKLTIDEQAGYVGIGTTNPSVPFHVVSNQPTAAYFDAATNAALHLLENGVIRGSISSRQANDADFELTTGFSNFQGDLHLAIRAVPKLTIDEDTGNVGIGTMTPTTTLTVNGDTSQPLSDNGMLKFLVHATCGTNASVSKQYNGTLNPGSVTTVAGPIGECLLTFPTAINTRYFQATPVSGNGDRSVACSFSGTSQLRCKRITASTGTGASGQIMVMIY